MNGANWKRVTAGEYVNQCGDRVFSYPRKAFGAQWGVQMSYWSQGDAAGTTMRSAMRYADQLRAVRNTEAGKQ